jgi:hypothetical protein
MAESKEEIDNADHSVKMAEMWKALYSKTTKNLVKIWQKILGKSRDRAKCADRRTDALEFFMASCSSRSSAVFIARSPASMPLVVDGRRCRLPAPAERIRSLRRRRRAAREQRNEEQSGKEENRMIKGTAHKQEKK